jgi:hypothetical protein
MRYLVYIAGPISRGDTFENVRAACFAWRRLWKMGHRPICPHWSHTQAMTDPVSYGEWLEYDLFWVDVSDAVLRLPGLSDGADQEVDFARKRGIPVFTSEQDLHAYFERRRREA